MTSVVVIGLLLGFTATFASAQTNAGNCIKCETADPTCFNGCPRTEAFRKAVMAAVFDTNCGMSCPNSDPICIAMCPQWIRDSLKNASSKLANWSNLCPDCQPVDPICMNSCPRTTEVREAIQATVFDNNCGMSCNNADPICIAMCPSFMLKGLKKSMQSRGALAGKWDRGIEAPGQGAEQMTGTLGFTAAAVAALAGFFFVLAVSLRMNMSRRQEADPELSRNLEALEEESTAE